MSELLACLTLDLEPDFLSDDRHEVLLDDRRFAQFADTVHDCDVALSVFVVAKMLDQGLPVRERFEPLRAEFELHSYSHNPREPDSRREIAAAKDAYLRYFGHTPRGYRAPLGFLTAEGVRLLHEEGFEYSSSIFPTSRRELRFDHSWLPASPFVWQEDGRDTLVEVPFGVTNRPRVVVSESYLKLLGLPPFKLLQRHGGLPAILVIDSHLYDFFATSPVLGLSRFDYRRYALLRNQGRALELLRDFVSFLKGQGYRFTTVGEVYERAVGTRADLPRVELSRLRSVHYRHPASGA